MPDTPISIFISYAHADSAFVDRLEADLHQQGFETWDYRQRLKGGQRWRRELHEAVKRAQVLLIVLSPEAVASQNVQIEYDYVLELGNVVIPLYYRQCEVPMELRAIQWIDFRHSYEQGIAALTQALHTQQDKVTPLSSQTQPGDLGQQSTQKEPAAAGPPAFNNLPTQLTSLIGREQDIQTVCALMRQPEVRLVTLLGTGGVGKRRLGLAVAESMLADFADGVCFVPPGTHP
jgi:TIR domain